MTSDSPGLTTSSCGGEELANFLGRVGPEFRAYTYNLVIKYFFTCFLIA